MKNDRQIDDIIDLRAAGLFSGQETVESIVEEHPELDQELRPRLEALQWLAGSKQSLEPRPGFIAASRRHLERQAALMMQQRTWERIFRRNTPQHWAFYVTAPALIVVLVALMVNSLVLTARLALPGDALFPVKILVENARLALTFDQGKKSELYIQYTRERTSEFVDLVIEGNYKVLPSAAARLETELIASIRSIDALNSQGRYVEQPMSTELRDALSNEISMLNILKGTSPSSASAGIDLVINVAESGLMALR